MCFSLDLTDCLLVVLIFIVIVVSVAGFVYLRSIRVEIVLRIRHRRKNSFLWPGEIPARNTEDLFPRNWRW
jgi:hypothetical protein